MAQLGKPLVFHLKYMAEMLHLQEDEEGDLPNLEGLEDAGQVRKMAHAVGAAAYEQAADFLELCGQEVEKHFSGLGVASLVKKKKRSTVRETWNWSAKFEVPSVPGGSFSCGVFVSAPPEISAPLPAGAFGAVVPWIWSKGGRNGADAVWKSLGGWPHSRGGGGLVGANADIALACIPVTARPPDGFAVEQEPLLGAVAKTVARIGAKEVKAIAKYVASLSEADDD